MQVGAGQDDRGLWGQECVLVTKFEMAGEADVLNTFLAALKVLHFVNITPPFSTVGNFTKLRQRM